MEYIKNYRSKDAMRESSEKMNNIIADTSTQQLPMKNSKPHIFISRGKDSAIIVEQLKELLTLYLWNVEQRQSRFRTK